MEIKDRILVVEDDKRISSFFKTVLESNRYDVIMASTGSEAYSLITSQCPDLVILDLGLPDMDGMNILRSVREWSSMPVIVVSARTHEKDKVEALDMGADDYITKPFGTSELLARIRTAIRHSRAAFLNQGGAPTGTFVSGGLTIDYDKHRVFVDGTDAGLTQNEYKIVSLLGEIRREGDDLRFHHQGDLGAQHEKRQPDPAGQHGQYPPEDRKKSCGAPVYFYRGGRGLPDRGAGLRGGQGVDGTEGISHFLPFGQKLVEDGGIGGGGTVEKDNSSWVDTAQELFKCLFF